MDTRHHLATTKYEWQMRADQHPPTVDLDLSQARVTRWDNNPAHITPIMNISARMARELLQYKGLALCWRTLTIDKDTWRLIGHDQRIDVYIFREE